MTEEDDNLFFVLVCTDSWDFVLLLTLSFLIFFIFAMNNVPVVGGESSVVCIDRSHVFFDRPFP